MAHCNDPLFDVAVRRAPTRQRDWLEIVDPAGTGRTKVIKLDNGTKLLDAHQGKLLLLPRNAMSLQVTKEEDGSLQSLGEVKASFSYQGAPAMLEAGWLLEGDMVVTVPTEGGVHRKVTCINHRTGRQKWALSDRKIKKVFMSPTREWVIVQMEDELRFLRTSNGARAGRLFFADAGIADSAELNLSFSPDGRFMAIMNAAKGLPALPIVDLTTGNITQTLAVEANIPAVRWSPDSSYLVAGLAGFDLKSGLQVWNYRADANWEGRLNLPGQSRYWYVTATGDKPDSPKVVVAANLLDDAIKKEWARRADAPRLLAPDMKVAVSVTSSLGPLRNGQLRERVINELVRRNRLIPAADGPLIFEIQATITPGPTITRTFFTFDKEQKEVKVTFQEPRCTFSARLVNEQSVVIWSRNIEKTITVPDVFAEGKHQKRIDDAANAWVEQAVHDIRLPTTIHPPAAGEITESHFSASGLKTQ